MATALAVALSVFEHIPCASKSISNCNIEGNSASSRSSTPLSPDPSSNRMQVFSYNLTPFRSHSYRLAIPDRVPTTDWTQAYGAQVGRFLGYLVNTGYIGPLEPVREPTLPDPLEKFRTWLECHRGITARSIHRYIRHIAAILPDLGDEPRAYDAALVRLTLFRHIEHRSRHYAKRLTGAMRMYLRSNPALLLPRPRRGAGGSAHTGRMGTAGVRRGTSGQAHRATSNSNSSREAGARTSTSTTSASATSSAITCSAWSGRTASGADPGSSPTDRSRWSRATPLCTTASRCSKA